MVVKRYQYAKEKQQNPYIGFTSFQHFRNDPLYSDLIVKPENNMTETEHVECYPVPAYVEENGRTQGYYPDCSVVYIRILWKEFEPKEQEYNYAFIEDILQKARQHQQTVMFRLMQHSTRESDDVPDWLKEKIECPVRPAGKRVKECPSDPRFLTYFGRAIRAFGQRFDGDPTLAMVDISLPGAWGEGSHLKFFTEAQLTQFADIYTDVFRHTLLIGQTNAPWLVHHTRNSLPVGWRADCIGPENAYQRLLPQAEQLQDVWKTGHVAFESYWWLGEWKRQGWDPDTILQRLLDWHVSTFNAKSLPIPFEWQEKIEAFIAKMGYHFAIREASFSSSVEAGGQLRLSVTIENIGVAPIYVPVPLYIRLKNSTGELVLPADTDIRKWLPGTHTETMAISLPEALLPGKYQLQLGIGGYCDPCVFFATGAQQDGHFAILTEITVE